MEQTKGLSCQIPESLHAKVTAERIAANQSLSEYITDLLINYYENGGKNDMAQTRTMAFQIDEDLFQRIKDYLARESERQGRKVTQREFVLGLIEDALRQAEQEAAEAAPDVPDDIPAPAEDQEADAEMESEDEETAEGGIEDVAECTRLLHRRRRTL